MEPPKPTGKPVENEGAETTIPAGYASLLSDEARAVGFARGYRAAVGDLLWYACTFVLLACLSRAIFDAE